MVWFIALKKLFVLLNQMYQYIPAGFVLKCVQISLIGV